MYPQGNSGRFSEKTQSGGEKCDTDGIRPGSAYSGGEKGELEDGVAEERESSCVPRYGCSGKKDRRKQDIISFLAECFELSEEEARECYQRITQEEIL